MEGVGDQVDGFGGAGGDQDVGGVEAEEAGEGAFQPVGLRLGIVPDGVEPLAQMRLQGLQVHVTIDIRAEIRPDGPRIAVGVVSVSLNHRFPFKMS